MRMREHPKTNEARNGFTSITKVAGVWDQCNTRFAHSQETEGSSVLDPKVNRYRCVFRVPDCSTPTFLPSLAPRPLRRFITTMKALTPVRVSLSHRSPCFTYLTFRSFRPQPPDGPLLSL
jgi:hypothetical protein